MADGYSWEARWIDPSTRLPARIARDGFASASEAREDALQRAPRVAVIALFGLDGALEEVFARQPRRATVVHREPQGERPEQ